MMLMISMRRVDALRRHDVASYMLEIRPEALFAAAADADAMIFHLLIFR